MAEEREKKDTDDLGQRGARLGGDQSDEVEGESLIEVPTIMVLGQHDATGGKCMKEDPRRRRPPGP